MIILLAFAFVIALTSNPPGYSIPPAIIVAGGKLFKADYISDAQKVDEIYTDGRYIILSKSAHPIFTSGAILISVSVLEYVFQIAISLGNKELFYRTTKKENAWGTWLKLHRIISCNSSGITPLYY